MKTFPASPYPGEMGSLKKTKGAWMNIYVGNLSWEVTGEDLQKAFEAFGQVTSANVIKDKFSGQSKGFGFVEMPSKEQGQAAINELNGKEMKGRNITVNEARARTEGGGGRPGGGRPGGGGGGNRFGGGRPGSGGGGGGGRRY
jgi:cold-inducible RNA-binding protein